jgi:hypothetical protein
MNMQKVFSRTFERSRLDALRWIETKRHGTKEAFGKKSDDELDPKYFIESDGSPRIPPDIGDAFNYSLQGSEVQVNFGQDYWNSIPLASYQYLGFVFGRQRNPKGEFDNPLGADEGFEFLAEANMTLYRGQHGSPKTNIDMQSQNLGIHNRGYLGEKNSFTECGKAIMADLLSQKRNILRIAGICDSEHKELETFLDLIEQKYKSAELVPRDVFYT